MTPTQSVGSLASPAGWRCEQCRRIQPMDAPSFLVYVEDFGVLRLTGSIRRRSRFVVAIVMCRACRRSALDMPGEEGA